MKVMTKTGIVATLGPASGTKETIAALVESGVGVFRLNFSHGDAESHGRMLSLVRQAGAKLPWAIGVMGDLCGPKIRTGEIEPQGEILIRGQSVEIRADSGTGTARSFGVNRPEILGSLRAGQRILIDDGRIALAVREIKAGGVVCGVLAGGPICSHKGLNLPDTETGISAITEDDWKWADWAVRNELDYLALSFVQSSGDVCELKEYLAGAGSRIKVAAKIEKPRAVELIESIAKEADAVLVARGDLGVEMDLAEVPLVQKRITGLCRRLGKPVIVATQVVQSMIERPEPTRAEVSDVANAVMDYADAIMLSGETAVGRYPVESARVVERVCRRTEAFMEQSEVIRPQIETEEGLRELAAIARMVGQMLDQVRVELVVVWTESGVTARLLSKSRLDVPILALCPQATVCRQLSLHYGVIGVEHRPAASVEEFVKGAEELILKNGWGRAGGQILIIPPRQILSAGTTHALILRTLG